jgi:hypothetical protein
MNPGIEKEVVLKLKIAFEMDKKMHQADPMKMTRNESEGMDGSSVSGTSPVVLIQFIIFVKNYPNKNLK